MKYILSGEPIPLARARHAKGRTYNSQSIIQNRCKLDLNKQHNKQPLLKGPIALEINFYMPIPLSWSQSKKERMAGQPHISKPDWSNLLKFVEDCGTGILYTDDSLIYQVTGTKIYDWFARTEFILNETKP